MSPKATIAAEEEERHRSYLLGELASTALAVDSLLKRRDRLIVSALEAGASSRAVGEAAGMSNPGVLAVRKRLEAEATAS